MVSVEQETAPGGASAGEASPFPFGAAHFGHAGHFGQAPRCGKLTSQLARSVYRSEDGRFSVFELL